MCVLAILAGLMGIFVIAMMTVGPFQEVMQTPQFQQALKQRPADVTDDEFLLIMRIAFIAAGVMALLTGAGLYVLSFFVRKGGSGAVITAIVLTSLILLWLGVNVIGSIGQIGAFGVGAIVVLPLVLLPIALAIRQMRWLIAAAKAAPHLRMMAARDRSLQMPWRPAPSGPAHLAHPAPPGTPSSRLPQPGYYHQAYLQPPQPPGYDQPGSGPVGYGYPQPQRGEALQSEKDHVQE